MPKYPPRDTLTDHQIDLIANYEMREQLIRDLGRTAEMDLDAWMKERTTEDCAFLLHYMGCRSAVMKRNLESIRHGQPCRTH